MNVTHFRTKAQFRASVAIATIESAMILERLRKRGDKLGAAEADAIETLVELAKEYLGEV